jgi:hypothetical protein
MIVEIAKLEQLRSLSLMRCLSKIQVPESLEPLRRLKLCSKLKLYGETNRPITFF